MNLFTMLLISAKKISNLLWSFVTNEIPNQPTENFTEVGDITESEDKVFTNFSGSNYLYFNNLDLSNSTWEKHLKVKTGSDIDSWQTVYSLGTEDQRGDMLCIYESKFGLVVSYSGSYWNIEEYNSSYTLSTNTIYYVKVKFDGESYKIDLSTDGETYSNILTYSSSTNISVYPIRFNIGWRAYSPSSLYFRGTAYLQDWKIYKSGSLIWSGYSMPLNVGDAIKLNEGLGYANYKWNAYPSTTTISQTVGSGLNNLGIKKGIFEAQVNPTYSKTTGTTNYEFIYNGTDWTYSSNNIDLDDYGIFYNTSNSSVSNGDKIQVIYTVYSKYAVFVLDSSYRATASFGTYGTDIPNYPNYYDMSDGSGSDSSTWYYLQNVGKESATWCNEQLLDNRGFSWNNLPAMSYCRSLGKYIMANGIEVYPLLPNPTELYTIYSNRVSIDNYDPIIQSGTTTNNLTNWTIGGTDYIMACVEYSNNRIWNLKSDGEWEYYYSSKDTNYGIIPIFEVPCI